MLVLSRKMLQWVRGRMTAVMSGVAPGGRFLGGASMGPRSDDRGYAAVSLCRWTPSVQLQWVRGRMTAVMTVGRVGAVKVVKASMGPRSDDRGYAQARPAAFHSFLGFNGSAVG